MSSEVKEVTRKTLEKIKYGDLQTKFEELGIGELFERGKKKTDLIDAALKGIAILKEKQEAEVSVDLKEEVAKPEPMPDGMPEFYKKFSQDEIDFQIKRINANLKNNIPAQRNLLLKKLTWLESLKE